MVPVDDLVEGAAVGVGDRLEGPVGRIAQGQHVGADPVLGYAENAPAGLLVADGRVARTDAQVGGGQHHRHGRLAQVVLVDGEVALLLRLAGGSSRPRRPPRPGAGLPSTPW